MMETQQLQQSQQSQKPQEVKNPFEKLDEAHQFAVNERYSWTPYKMIVKDLQNIYSMKITEQSVRRWFMQGGDCYEALEFLKRQRLHQHKIEVLEVDTKLKESAVLAAGIIQRELNGGEVSEQQLATARDILDRTGYPKQTKIENSGRIESKGMEELAAGIRAILNPQRIIIPQQKVINAVPAQTNQQNGQK